MSTIANLNVLLTASTAGLSKGLKQASSMVGSFAGGIGGILTSPVGLLAEGLGLGASIHAAQAHAATMKKLDAVLGATGNTTGKTREQLLDMAESLEKTTNFSHNATIGAETMLATFHNINGSTFDAALKSAQDLTAILGGDLQGNALKIGKALDNPIRGMKTLSKLGVTFSEQQKASITKMASGGNIAGAQAAILQQLQGKFGGAAQATASPMKGLMNSLEGLAEAVGGIFLPIVNKAIAIFRPMVDGIAAVIRPLGPIVSNVFESIIDFVSPIAAELKNVWAAEFAVIGSAASAMWDGISSVFAAFGITSQGLGSIFQSVRQTIQQGLLIIEFSFTHWQEVGALAMASVEYSVVKFANQVIYFFTTALPGYLDWFNKHWFEVFTDIVNFTGTLATNIWKNLSSLWDAIVGLFNGEGFNWKFTGLTEGFKSAITELPKIAERQIGPLEASLNNQVQSLGNKVGQDFAAFSDSRTKELQDAMAQKVLAIGISMSKLGLGLAGVGQLNKVGATANNSLLTGGGEEPAKLGALVRGSAEAFKAEKTGNTPLDKIADNSDKQVKALQKIEENTSEDSESDDTVSIP